MPPSKSTITDRESVDQAVSCSDAPASGDILVTEVSSAEDIAAQWNALVDHKLIEWGNTRHEFQCEGLIGPSNEALSKALRFIVHMRRNNWPLPTGMIPDGEGGIVFENRCDPSYQRIEIDEHGSAYLATFRDCKLMARVPIDVE